MKRRLWHLLNAALLLNLVLLFTTNTATSKTIHAISAICLGLAVVATRPKQPPTHR